jgi:hypothetical protein
MKLLDDPKIPTTRQNRQRSQHSHKPLDVAAEMGLKLEDHIARLAATATRAPPLQTLIQKTKNKVLKIGVGALPPMRTEIHHISMAQKP